MDEVHPLDRRRRGDHRQAVAHREVDLALDARAVAQRRDRRAAAGEERRDVGHVPRDDEVRRGERADRRRHLAADDVGGHAGQPLAHLRQHLARIPEHGVGVRRVLEAADEHQALAFGERLAARQRLVDVRQQQDPRTRHQPFQHLALDRRDDDRHVDAPDERELLVAPGPRGGPGHRPALQLGEPLGAQEVHVHGVEGDRRLRREPADQLDVLHRDVVPRDDDEVELAAATVEDLRHRADVGRVQHLDAPLLQVAHVGLAVLEVVADQRHLRAGLDRELEHRERAHRPRVLVGRQHARLDHQHAPRRATVALELRMHAVVAVRDQRRTPLLAEGVTVDLLVPLDPRPEVGARGLTLEVHDRRRRLVVDAASRGAHREREVGVLVVRGPVAHVEAADLPPERNRDREARAGAVVDLAQVVVLGAVGIVVAADVPRRAVAPDDAARLLQPAVGIDELRADQPGVGPAVEHREQRVEPARRDDRVVVEQHQEVAAGELRAAVAAADEAQVLRVALEAHAGDLRKRLGSRFRRRVVHDDHLAGRDVRVGEHALQAREREQRLAVDGDHDRCARRVHGRERERHDGLGLRVAHRLRRPEPRAASELARDARGERPRPLVAQQRHRERGAARQLAQPARARAHARGDDLAPVHRGAQRRRHPPRGRALELVGASARVLDLVLRELEPPRVAREVGVRQLRARDERRARLGAPAEHARAHEVGERQVGAARGGRRLPVARVERRPGDGLVPRHARERREQPFRVGGGIGADGGGRT